MPRDCILAIDQGTTASRAVVVGPDASVLSQAKCEFPQHFPQPGWVEHDLEEIWQSVVAAVGQAVRQVEGGWERMAAIGITNQRETVGVWDRDSGKPVAPAIVWQCRRTEGLCEALRERAADRIRELTGLPVDPYFSGPKLQWLLDHVPEIRAHPRRYAAGTVDSFLIWRLTWGVHRTDPTNASRTLLFDIDRKQWSPELLDLMDIPPQLLPEVIPSGAEFGVTASAEDIPANLPVLANLGDQQAALLGQGCVGVGQAKNTYGTGCFLLLNTGAQRVDSTAGLLTTLACDATGHPCYALEGSVFMGGAVIQWLRDQLGIIQSAQDSEALARSVPDTAGVQFVPAFVGLGAPHWDPAARGAILGLTRGAGRAHIARAALEAVAQQCTDVIEAMEADGPTVAELKVDGGASANDLLMQMQADLSGVPVVRPGELEMTALGAAYLAGIKAELWERPWQGKQAGQARFEPAIPAAEREWRRQQWRAAVSRVRSSLPQNIG